MPASIPLSDKDRRAAVYRRKRGRKKTVTIETATEREIRAMLSIPDLSEAMVSQCQRLFPLLHRKARRLLLLGGSAWLINQLAAHPWIRPVEDWRCRGRSDADRLRSLIEHLLIPYSAPTSLYQEIADLLVLSPFAYFERQEMKQQVEARLALVVRIGTGTSLQKLPSFVLPGCLTHRMRHRLHSTPARTFMEAIRTVQVEVLGGPPSLVDALMQTVLGRELQGDEPFWQSVIHWLCRQPKVSAHLLNALFPYLSHRRMRDRSFSMRGRTLPALHRALCAHTASVQAARRAGTHEFVPCGLEGATFDLVVEGVRQQWTAREVLSSQVLAAEGIRMRHCVQTYRRYIQRGELSIWSVSLDSVPVLTVAIRNRFGKIVQARGVANRRPTATELDALRYWAQIAGLQPITVV